MKKFYRILGGIILLILIALTGASFYMLNYSIEAPTNGYASQWRKLHIDYPQLRDWLDSVKNNNRLGDTTITLANGLRGHAFYLRNDSAQGKSAICIHGTVL